MNASYQAHPSIAIIGAGLAGLSCARSLQSAGVAVQLYEKSRGPGGRAATRRVDPDLSFDHGAQYFTVRDPEFANVVSTWRDAGIVAEWTGSIVKWEAGQITATSPLPRYVGTPGMSAIGSHLANGLTIDRHTRIIQLHAHSTGWILEDESGPTHGPFDAVVVALPSLQASELLAEHPFSSDAAQVVMKPCWAVLVAFEHRLESPWDAAFVHGSSLAWVCRNSSKPGRPTDSDCWVLHATSDWTTAHLEESTEDVAHELLKRFADLHDRPLPPIRYQAAHRWRYSIGADAAERKVLHDPQSRLIVCGDWLAGGRVEGAFRSGKAAANALQTAGE